MGFNKEKCKKRNTNPIKTLIVGNGFDIAHGLPTQYTDFLNFCNEISSKIWKGQDFNCDELSKMPTVEKIIDDNKFVVYGGWYSMYQHENKQYVEPYFNKINELLSSNIWECYFQQMYKYNCMQGENWIDFEKEISLIIQSLDEFSQNLLLTVDNFTNNLEFTQIQTKKSDCFLYAVSACVKDRKLYSINLKTFRALLFDHLENFIETFQIYLEIFVKSQTITEKSPDIIEINPDYIVSFNYTSTHLRENLYNKPKLGSVFVHGDASVDPNNMVLGINEYWTDDRKNTHTNYSIFKKPIQRIQKKTAVEIYDFLRILNKNKNYPHEFYFFGHSLDITDKDILYEIFSLENSRIIIFYHDKTTEAQYIENVIKIMEHDAFFEKMKAGRIEFRQQQNMVECGE